LMYEVDNICLVMHILILEKCTLLGSYSNESILIDILE
jgi:hypothetical protein